MFAQVAGHYWAAGLPVVPALINTKKIVRMSVSCTSAMPPTDLQQDWLERHAGDNIALALGPCAGIEVLNINTHDVSILSILNKVLPKSPWKCFGRRGFNIAFKFAGHRPGQLLDRDRQTVVEVQSSGRFLLLPPSVHPDGGIYTSRHNLYDSTKTLKPMPKNVLDKLETAFQGAGLDIAQRRPAKKAMNGDYLAAQLKTFAAARATDFCNGRSSLADALRLTCEWWLHHTAEDDFHIVSKPDIEPAYVFYEELRHREYRWELKQKAGLNTKSMRYYDNYRLDER
ncbi:DNA primase/polymerase [Asticcacaulis biprosthecium C19]|uniref:DNA primase/polymerase n=1 Tax=Asticcacaulis biprosthecium C19 TaxID=715226 RepID=F4QP34_9CAUL|nr:bifunctional DNA primase/polymerase [Asticcacaulis biprosthecium]EGF91092.1 DNA primase/polymerase [Asticcacaulis biprosthecium C19]